jgi:bisanhydrobacterioruberin hydratase
MRSVLKDITSFFFREEKEVRKFFIIFYAVGVLGIVIPFTRSIFIYLTPVALLISFVYILFYHKEGFDTKKKILFISIFLVSYFIEVIGVKTGLIFGNYSYGKGLGLKFLETPLVIGINWLLLVYSTAAITEKFPLHIIVKILLSAFLMVIYDIIMEQVAPDLQMWDFEGGLVPVRNYLTWFILAFLFHSIIKLAGIKITNKLAALIFYCQLSFFGILFLFFTLMK